MADGYPLPQLHHQYCLLKQEAPTKMQPINLATSDTLLPLQTARL